MQLLSIAFFILILFNSCQQKQKESYSELPANCDSVAMIYYNNNETLQYVTGDSLEIAVLTEPVIFKNDNIGDSCKPSGKLLYKRNGKVIFTAEFSTPDTNDSLTCNYIVYELHGSQYKHQLTYRAGMLIDDILWGKLQWSDLSDHGPIRLHGDTGRVVNKEFTKALMLWFKDSAK